jgi:VanZ family protein
VENVKRWGPAIAWAALIFIASSIPGNEVNRQIALHDKLAHTTVYAVFAFLLARGLGLRRWWWAIIVGALYGVTDEFHQTFTPMRSGNDLGDLTADTIGSAIGATAWFLLRRRRRDGTKTA